MIRNSKSLSVGRRILLGSFMITVLGSGISAYAQTGQGPQGRNNNPDDQRTQQYDQLQQLQQQQQDLRNMDVSQRSFALSEELPFLMWRVESERARLKELLRANFRRHYAIIRKNADDLTQLTSSLQTDIAGSGDQELTRDMIAKTTKMQKLAHEILDNLAGQKLPKSKAGSAASSTGAVGIGLADHKQLLSDKTNDAKTTAATLKKAVDDYLASDNEQAVSVSALKTTSKEHFDPNSVAIIKACVRLQQLSDEIRSEMRMVNALR